MKIKKVILDPDGRLKAPNYKVTQSWNELEPMVRKMFKLMYRTGIGVGLAAPQVGWNVQLFIMNADKDCRPQQERVYWNPKILAFDGDPKKMKEGCLSLPNFEGHVLRYPRVRLRAMTPQGEVDDFFEGLGAQIVQHEMDHLDGKLCSDRFI